jgi:hypothetical protein
MKYTAEKKLAKAELEATALYSLTDEILSYISVDAHELEQKLEVYMISRTWNLAYLPKLFDYVFCEWEFVESFGVANHGKQFLSILIGSLTRNDMSDVFEAVFRNISSGSQPEKHMKTIMRIVLENGNCRRIFEVVQKNIPADVLYKYFTETYNSESLTLLNRFMSLNPQYGYFLHQHSIVYRQFESYYFYVGPRSKIYHLPQNL